MTSNRLFMLLGVAMFYSACAPQQKFVDQPDQSARWVGDSAEYRALANQVYRAASMALPALVADETWSAIPYQANAENLPPAIIMDIGDDLGDFIPCVRRTPVAPCKTGGTIANRFTLTAEHDAYWGAGWVPAA